MEGRKCLKQKTEETRATYIHYSSQLFGMSEMMTHSRLSLFMYTKAACNFKMERENLEQRIRLRRNSSHVPSQVNSPEKLYTSRVKLNRNVSSRNLVVISILFCALFTGIVVVAAVCWNAARSMEILRLLKPDEN